MIDLPEEVLAKLDLVIASRHAIANQYEPAKIKESLLAAIDNPAVDIIGHPYRHIEFYEHDWRYFKKYWQNKDKDKCQRLLELERAEDWNSIKKIIGKLPPDGDKEIEKFALDFRNLKRDYWQAWEEILSAMEKKGKAFEINLSTFLPQKEFYCTLLAKAARYKKLKFSIAYDFHTLDQGQSQDKTPDVPEVKNPGRAGRIQRLLDLIKLLEKFNIDKSRLVNSSAESLNNFINFRKQQEKNDYLEQSPDKKYTELESVSQQTGYKLINWQVERLRQQHGEIQKLLIKYETERGDIIYLKKDSDYDMRKLRSLMELMNRFMPGKTNEVLAADKDNAIFYKGLKGIQLREFLSVSAGEKAGLDSAGKLADLIYSFHHLELSQFKSHINYQNQSLPEIRFSAQRDLVGEIAKYDKGIAGELDDLYQTLSSLEKNILATEEPVLIHGDFHPGNILIDDEGGVKLIDYKNLTQGVKERDLASMLEQVYAQVYLPAENRALREKVSNWQEKFLKAYPDKINEKNLIFYRAWICWRNALYCYCKYFLGQNKAEDAEAGRFFIQRGRDWLEDYQSA